MHGSIASRQLVLVPPLKPDEDTFYQYGGSLARGYFEDDKVIHEGKVMPFDSLRFIMHMMPETQKVNTMNLKSVPHRD